MIDDVAEYVEYAASVVAYVNTDGSEDMPLNDMIFSLDRSFRYLS